MHAIIRLGDGKYYTSEVFAYYCDPWEKDENGEYYGKTHGRYYIVFNREKTALVKQRIFDKKNKYLRPLILICDSSQDDWNFSNGYQGEVSSTTKEELLEMVETGFVPEEFIKADAAYKFEEYKTITTQKDIEDFDWVSGNLHDAYIEETGERDGVLRVLFDGV